MNRALATALAIISSATCPSMASAVDLMHFSVTQVRQLDIGTPAVRAYLDIADSQGQHLSTLPESSVSATLGEWPAELVELTPASSVQQGVAFIFLVDISKSLSPDLFRQMVGGIEIWIDGLGPSDRAAIIAFGEASRLVVDFTAEKDRLLAALASLGPTDDKTLLHQSLADALDLSRRLDADLPGRRAIVVFGDGKDEGSAYQAEDVLAKLREGPAPVYAIGYSRLRDAADRRAYLDLLRRFAFVSGGTFFEAEQTMFTAAYAAIQKSIGEVWVADFVCSRCLPDGTLRRLQVKVDLGGQVLSSGGSVRLLPLASDAEPDPSSVVPDAPDLALAEPDDLPDASSEQPQANRYRMPRFVSEYLPWFLGAAVASVALLLFWLIRASRVRAKRLTDPLQHFGTSAPPGSLDPRSEPEVLDPPMPVPYPDEVPSRPLPPPQDSRPRIRARFPPKQVRLIVVRGSRQGRQYSFVVDRQAIVGKRSDSDCVLSQEPGIDAEQFELTHEDGGLFVRNLSDARPTLITGQPLVGKVRLASNTLIGTGETVLRIVFF